MVELVCRQGKGSEVQLVGILGKFDVVDFGGELAELSKFVFDGKWDVVAEDDFGGELHLAAEVDFGFKRDLFFKERDKLVELPLVGKQSDTFAECVWDVKESERLAECVEESEVWFAGTLDVKLSETLAVLQLVEWLSLLDELVGIMTMMLYSFLKQRMNETRI